MAEFLGRFWAYYDELLAYREHPTESERARLSARFDEVFSTEPRHRTDYHELNDRIEKTRAKRSALPTVLGHPEIPLHNNPAELGARQRVRKRDVSFGPPGARWDPRLGHVPDAFGHGDEAGRELLSLRA